MQMSLAIDFNKKINKVNDLKMQYMPIYLQLLQRETRQSVPLCSPNTMLMGLLPWCDW
ncbi:hypothetical protein L63ED372_00229 [Limnohabitans sp. 63ED37-2]|nr:hypothetical protein L63ED372_00229 [Limnohabitans sp. 63ED37-2]